MRALKFSSGSERSRSAISALVASSGCSDVAFATSASRWLTDWVVSTATPLPRCHNYGSLDRTLIDGLAQDFESSLLAGPMIRARTNARNTSSPPVAKSKPSVLYARNNASHRCSASDVGTRRRPPSPQPRQRRGRAGPGQQLPAPPRPPSTPPVHTRRGPSRDARSAANLAATSTPPAPLSPPSRPDRPHLRHERWLRAPPCGQNPDRSDRYSPTNTGALIVDHLS